MAEELEATVDDLCWFYVGQKITVLRPGEKPPYSEAPRRIVYRLTTMNRNTGQMTLSPVKEKEEI